MAIRPKIHTTYPYLPGDKCGQIRVRLHLLRGLPLQRPVLCRVDPEEDATLFGVLPGRPGRGRSRRPLAARRLRSAHGVGVAAAKHPCGVPDLPHRLSGRSVPGASARPRLHHGEVMMTMTMTMVTVMMVAVWVMMMMTQKKTREATMMVMVVVVMMPSKTEKKIITVASVIGVVVEVVVVVVMEVVVVVVGVYCT